MLPDDLGGARLVEGVAVEEVVAGHTTTMDSSLHCSGPFIGPDAILTAAHCLRGADFGRWVAGIRAVPGKSVLGVKSGLGAAP